LRRSPQQEISNGEARMPNKVREGYTNREHAVAVIGKTFGLTRLAAVELLVALMVAVQDPTADYESWPMDMAPDDYRERYPNGPNVLRAEAHLNR
jgi:hypothetical protein